MKKLSELILYEASQTDGDYSDGLTNAANMATQYEIEIKARDACVLAMIEELHRQALIASRARFALEAALREEAPDARD